MPFVPQADLPPPSLGGGLPVPQAVEQSDFPKKKVISIALAGILVIAGAVGIMYAFGVFGEGDADFVGQWVDNSGQVMSFDSNGTVCFLFVVAGRSLFVLAIRILMDKIR